MIDRAKTRLHFSLVVAEEGETSSHIVLLLFLLLLLGGSGSGGGSSSGGGGRGGGSGVSFGVGDHVLDLLGLLDGVVSSNGDGHDVLVGVDEQVGEGSNGGEVDVERKGGNAGNSGGNALDDELVGDVEDLGLENISVVVDLEDGETIREGLDVQQLEEGGLGGTYLISDLDDGNVRDDFNLTLGNLGRDVKRLQERGLSGLETGVSLGNRDIERGDGSGLGGGGYAHLHELIAACRQVLLGEDETDVSPDVLEENLDGGNSLQVLADGLSDESVLSHQDDSVSTGQLTDALQLVRTDVIGVHEEATRVLVDESLDALEERNLLLLGHG